MIKDNHLPALELPTDGSLVHNWLYSFLPTGVGNQPALVGFCKQCRRTFCYVMQTPPLGYYKEFDAQIPKFGCIPVENI
jgi:hypothetical protein